MLRKFLRLVVAFLLSASLISACASAADVSPATSQQATTIPVTITIWHQWSSEHLNAIQAVFNQYMAEHPYVTIVLDAPQDMQSSLPQAIPNGIGPDIISWANDSIGSYAKSGYIVDLGSLGVSQDYLRANYEPAAATGVVWQGKLWGLPASQDTIAIVYNKALVSEANFPSDPMDFAGLLAKAKAYAQSHPGKYLLCNQGLGSADAYNVAPIYFGFGVPGYVDENGKAYLNTPQALQAGNWIKDFSVFSPKKASHDICSTGIASGTYASWWTDALSIADFEALGIDYGIVPMGKPFVGVESLMVTMNTTKRGSAATALDIIKYITDQANETQLALADHTIPANSGAIKDPQVQAIAIIRGFGAAANLGIALPNSPYAETQWGPVGDATQAIWDGSLTPEIALSSAQTSIETAVAKMK